MRKLSLFMLVFCVLLCSCSSERSEPLITGKYQLENANEFTIPYVLLKGDNEFIFLYSNLSGYLIYGTYETDNDTLILTTEDDAYTYVFQIIDGSLYFNLEKSSKIIEYKGETPIEDRAEFILVK